MEELKRFRKHRISCEMRRIRVRGKYRFALFRPIEDLPPEYVASCSKRGMVGDDAEEATGRQQTN